MTVVREPQINADLAQPAFGVENVIECRDESSAKVVLMDRHADDVAEHVREVKWRAAHAPRERRECPARRRSPRDRRLCRPRDICAVRSLARSHGPLRATRRGDARGFPNELGDGLFDFQGARHVPNESVTKEAATNQQPWR